MTKADVMRAWADLPDDTLVGCLQPDDTVTSVESLTVEFLIFPGGPCRHLVVLRLAEPTAEHQEER